MANTKRAFYGIDLGTTHTVVVKAIKEGNDWKYTNLKLPNMPISDYDPIKYTELLPSAVYYKRNGEAIVGEYAKQMIHFDPENVYINAKIDLGGRLDPNTINEHTPLEISQKILEVCFAQIMEDGGEKASVRISDTETAAQNALFALNFSNIKLVRTTEEPFAALVNLVVNESKFTDMIKSDTNTIMLIDIGGGTMDIIISDISYQGNNTLQASTPYEPAKHDEFAGAKFDFELMKKFMQDFKNHYELSENDLTTHNKIILEKRMLLIAEDAKKFLCNKDNEKRTYEFTCDFEELNLDLSNNSPFKISLTKKQMDIALENLLSNKSNVNGQQSIKDIINKTLSDNNLSPTDIDCIYLTGGMANYDQLEKTIQTVISKPIIVATSPLFCTATGVALSLVIQTPRGTSEIARNIKTNNNLQTQNNDSDNINTDIPNSNKNLPISSDMVNINIAEANRMGMSYFIDVEDSMPIEIISKEETYPCLPKKSNVQLKTSSQSRMNLVLYELINVGTTIDISYKIDANKIITIYASIDGEAPFEFTTEED